MTEINSLASFADASLAVYANFNVGSDIGPAIQQLSGTSAAQADYIAARYTVIDVFNDTVTGSYAAVFEDKQTHQRIVAIRGTNDGIDLGADAYVLAGVPPSLNPQYLALRDKVAQWAQSGVITQGIAITGHSLGGYLAAALKRDYPNDFGAVYTFNAPGIEGALGSLGDFFGQAFGGALLPSSVIDVRGSKGLSLIGSLGRHLGRTLTS